MFLYIRYEYLSILSEKYLLSFKREITLPVRSMVRIYTYWSIFTLLTHLFKAYNIYLPQYSMEELSCYTYNIYYILVFLQDDVKLYLNSCKMRTGSHEKHIQVLKLQILSNVAVKHLTKNKLDKRDIHVHKYVQITTHIHKKLYTFYIKLKLLHS
jgi:hypothetical protein